MENTKAPENVLLLGGKDLLKIAIGKLRAKKDKTWKGKSFPLYIAEVDGKKIGISHYFYGSSAAAVNLEELIKTGAKNFVFTAYARPLAQETGPGSIILPTRAVRDEGTSFHYLKPAKQVIGNTEIEKMLKEEMKKNSLKTKTGLTWTTDAPYSKVRKTGELLNSKALCIDNECAALLAVARYRQASLGGILIVNEQSIRGKLKQKLKDPLKPLKNHVLRIAAQSLAKKSFWESLGEEKEAPAKKSAPREKPVPTWDARIEAVSAEIDSQILAIGSDEEGEEHLAEALEIKKELFAGEYHRCRSRFMRGKITRKKYDKVSLACIEILEKILLELKEIAKPGDQTREVLSMPDEAVSVSDEIAEEIYAQLAEDAEIDFYREPEEVKARKNRVSVFLVNLPRRFRYKPYYKKFFEKPGRVEKVGHEKFLEEY